MAQLEKEAEQAVVNTFVKQNPSLFADIDPELRKAIPLNAIRTIAQAQQSTAEAESLGYYNNRGLNRGRQPSGGIVPPEIQPENIPAPQVQPLSGSGQQAFEQFRTQKDPFRFVPQGAPPNLSQKIVEDTIKSDIDVEEAGAKEAIKTKQQVKESQLSSQFNLNLVTENMYDLSELLASAYQEGGAGNALSAMATEAAIRGFLPEGMAEKYSKASAVPGKKVEIISKMFPTLTQQIGKEGSVRLVESVFEKLGRSLPGLQTAPKLALEQMDASIQTMYRINRALESINLDEFDLETRAGEENFSERVARQATQVKITGEEREQLNKLKEQSLKPLRDYIKNRDSSKGGLSAKEQKELDEINKLLSE